MTHEEWEEEEKKKAKKEGDDFAVERQRVADDAATQVDAAYNGAIKEAETTYRSASDALVADFRKIYDSNVIDELVLQRSIKERMANLGLSNSGTQKAKQETVQQTRKWADIKTTKSKEEGVAAIMRELDAVRDQYLAEAASQKQQIQQDADADIEKVYADLETQAINRANELFDISEQGTQALADIATPIYKQVADTSDTSGTGSVNAVDTYKPSLNTIRTGIAVRLMREDMGMEEAWKYLSERLLEGSITSAQMEALAKECGLVLPSQQEYYTARAGDGRYEVTLSDEELAKKTGTTPEKGLADHAFAAVNEEYVKAFFDDYAAFVAKAQQDRGTVGYGNAASLYDSYRQAGSVLDTRAKAILTYLEEHREQLGEDNYTYLTDSIRSMQQGQQTVVDEFKQTADIIQRYSSEEAYTTAPIENTQTPYGPELITSKYDMPWAGSDNLASDKTLAEMLEENSGKGQDHGEEMKAAQHEEELREQYRVARDGQGKRFLHVEGGIDFSAVPDYSTVYDSFLKMQQQSMIDPFLAKLEEVQPTELTDRQKSVCLAGTLIYLYDQVELSCEQNGGYDPYQYLGLSDFRRRLSAGEIEGVDTDTALYALKELDNYIEGKEIAGDVSNQVAFVKLMFGYAAGLSSSIEALANLPQTVSGKLTHTSAMNTASDTVKNSIDNEAIKFLYTLGETAGSMTTYMVAGAAGGAVLGNTLMFIQGLSNSMSSALRDGKEYQDALLYGLSSASMEIAVNKLLGASGGALGSSVLGETANSFIQKGLSKLSANPLLKKLITVTGDRLVNTLGEGLEEALQAYIDPLLRNFYFDEHNQLTAYNEEAAYNGWIGAVIGLILGGGGNSVASTELLNGTDAENLQLVNALCEAAQALPLTDAQKAKAKDAQTYAQRYYADGVGQKASMNTQVQELLSLWTDTAVQQNISQGTDPLMQIEVPTFKGIDMQTKPQNEADTSEDVVQEKETDNGDGKSEGDENGNTTEATPPDDLQTAEYKAPEVDYTAPNIEVPKVQLQTPAEIAAQAKAAVDGNIPRIIDARNRYEPQKEAMSEAERATMIENIQRSINHENPRVVDARNRYEPQTFTMSEDERKALSDHIWRSINHELPRNYDVRNQGSAEQADSKATEQKMIDQADSKVYNQTNSSINARINALNREVKNEQQNVNNVASPVRIKCINQHLAGKKHPVTGVPYVERVVTIDGQRCVFVAPQFDSLFDTQLPDELRYASDDVQFRRCTYQLREELEANPELKAQFSEEQLQQIKHGKTPEGYTWHHDVEVGKMQLVLTEIHQKTGHTGGRSLWGGGSKYR